MPPALPGEQSLGGGGGADTSHRSVAMVRVYTRRADAFADHAGEGLL